MEVLSVSIDADGPWSSTLSSTMFYPLIVTGTWHILYKFLGTEQVLKVWFNEIWRKPAWHPAPGGDFLMACGCVDAHVVLWKLSAISKGSKVKSLGWWIGGFWRSWPSGQRIALWMFFDRRIWFGNLIHIPNFTRNSWYINRPHLEVYHWVYHYHIDYPLVI